MKQKNIIHKTGRNVRKQNGFNVIKRGTDFWKSKSILDICSMDLDLRDRNTAFALRLKYS